MKRGLKVKSRHTSKIEGLVGSLKPIVAGPVKAGHGSVKPIGK